MSFVLIFVSVLFCSFFRQISLYVLRWFNWYLKYTHDALNSDIPNWISIYSIVCSKSLCDSWKMKRIWWVHNPSEELAAKLIPMKLLARDLFRCFSVVFLSSVKIGSRIGNQYDQNAFAQKLFGIGAHRGDGVSDQCRFAELGRIAGRYIERTKFRCICGELFSLSLSL